jgi:type II secretory pathway component GspD/PulD (secretin)
MGGIAVNCDVTQRKSVRTGCLLLGLLLALTVFARGDAAQTPDAKPAEQKPNPKIYKTIYLANATDQQSMNDIVTALRTSLPRARFFPVGSQGAISVHATDDDLAVAQKIVADLDRPRKAYRLTYKITETEGGQTKEMQHFTLVVVPGSRTILKQGNRVPIAMEAAQDKSTAHQPVQYQDVGLSILASLSGHADALVLQTKVEVSSLADPAAAGGQRDPDIHQSVLDGESAIALGKPLVLGSLDIPGTTRHEEVEVVAELVR